MRRAFLVVAVLTACALDAQTWSPVMTTGTPGPVSSGAAAFDLLNGEVVIYGGLTCGACYSTDTWLYDVTTGVWTLATPARNPGALQDARMCYDLVRGRVVLFGGANGGGPSNATWEWDGASRTWTAIATTGTPPARFRGALAYDLNRARVVLFGGQWIGGGVFSAHGETWEYDGATAIWTQITTTPSPGPRESPLMAFDALRGKMVMFGGDTVGNSTTVQTSTWEYDGATQTWAQVPTAAWPTATGRHHHMWYDPLSGRTMLHGGTLSRGGGNPSPNTWAYDGVNWSLVATGPARSSAQLAYDGIRNVAFCFGGWDGGTRRNDAWEFSSCAATASYGVSGSGCGGVTISNLPGSLPKFGTTFTVIGSAGLTATSASMLLGFSKPANPIPLMTLGMAGCSLYADIAVVLPVPLTNGLGSVNLSIPTDAAWCGDVFYNQLATLDAAANPFGLALSNLGTATVGR